ncbi:MAG TPA: ACT domain-containing protein, partial [Candidatus Omnitrophica bacterium]|nr:ACT domain-containing protein [Candidatus Omnitrophota bacterium]
MNAILLISCPDKKGIVAQITNFIYENNGNIEHA